MPDDAVPSAPGSEAGPALEPHPVAGAAASPAQELPLRTILFIDDDPDWLEIVQDALTRLWPYTPLRHLVAVNLESGLAVLAQSEVDLIVLDLQLPGFTELEAVRALVEAMRTTLGVRPVVVMSGYLTTERRLQALRAGMQECVGKSEDAVFEHLSAAIQRAWSKHCAEQQLHAALLHRLGPQWPSTT
jgi:CheY-like chemotaxis protein